MGTGDGTGVGFCPGFGAGVSPGIGVGTLMHCGIWQQGSAGSDTIVHDEGRLL